ncbi:hypothetical protein BH11PLA2_BH11PLA2_45720 [soil metagenome]
MTDSTAKILIVDDVPGKLLSYRTILEDLNCGIVEARSGSEALSQILKEDFAVILLDVNMPDLSGFETAGLIRNRRKSAHTPIIFLTAFGDEVRVAQGYAHGAVDYLTTPVVPDILRAKVRVFLDLHRMTIQIRQQAAEQILLADEQNRRAALEEGSRRLHYLADVSRALSDSLDPDTTARTLVRQAVPFLADYASVTFPGEPGATEKAWCSSEDGQIHARRLDNTGSTRTVLADVIARVFASGRTEELTNLNLPFPETERERLHAVVVLPLIARNRILGVLALGRGPSRSTLATDDLALAEDLASRAAIALDNARLYVDVQRADRQKNDFLSMLAHELRNPLAPIQNAIEILRLRDSAQPDVVQTRDVIARQVKHMVRLVDDLLDISRITSGKIRLQMKAVTMTDIVSQAVEASKPLIDKGRHSLLIDPIPHDAALNADGARLTQVLTNMLNNAAKYSDDGGQIRVTVTCVDSEVVVKVKDHGIGMTPQSLSTVFDLFTQADRSLDRSHGGMGIGLTLVRRLVELHGGRVSAASEGLGHGSEFTIRLPSVIRTELTPVPGQLPKQADHNSQLRILIVDDNVDSAGSLAMLLKLKGNIVHVAHDGLSALDLARGERPDAAVLDIGLPGMDGYSLARRLRADTSTKTMNLIAVTGYGREEDRRLSREAGFDHHFVKPIELDALIRVLSKTSVRSSVASA